MATKALKKAAKASVQPTAFRQIIGIHVKFTLNTPDGLRRVIFELKKAIEDDVVQWTIGFQLFEREQKSDDFGDALIDLEVEVDAALNDDAESTADNGLNKKQTRHALGKAADTAKDSDTDEATKNAAVEETLKPNPS